jgi:hypothetical protein
LPDDLFPETLCSGFEFEVALLAIVLADFLSENELYAVTGGLADLVLTLADDFLCKPELCVVP